MKPPNVSFVSVAAVLLSLHSTAGVAQTVTAPASQVVVTSGSDWPTRTFQDPIDMNEDTDIGWWNYSVDQPSVDLSSQRFESCTTIGSTTDPSNRCFKATTTSTAGNFWVHDTGIPNLSARLGKTGDNFQIDADTHKVVAFRMRLTGTSCMFSSPSLPCTSSFLWHKGSLYDSPATLGRTNSFFTADGWVVYLIDFATIGLAPGSNTPWSGTIGDLRHNLTAISGASVEIDWIRLVPTGLTPQTISWTGFSGAVDIYLDNNTTQADGNIGLIDQNASASISLPSSGSYPFPAGALAPGDYFVQICSAGSNPASSSSCRYSAGSYRVNATPTLTFTSPSPEGSTDDFATVQLNNAWDMTSLSDVDRSVNVTNLVATTLPGANEAGASLGNVNVLQGNAVNGTGDPYLYTLWFAGDGRGRYKKIDTNRYHILTVEAGLPNKARDINLGSIARVVWQVEGFPGCENVSDDIIVNHRAGANVMSKVTVSMRTLIVEAGAGSPCHNGWVGNVESFRYDSHEFPDTQAFYVKSVKLTANERTASNQYVVRWTYTDALNAGSPTLALYYDTDTNPAGRVQIVAGLNPSTSTSHTWNTGGVPAGTYYIQAEFSDGLNTNSVFSKWPIVVDPSSTGSLGDRPRITLNRARLNFGGTANGQTLTSAQQVKVTILGAGASSVAWRVVSSDPTIQVSPTTGTGNGTVTVSVASSSGYPDNLIGDYSIRVEEVTAGTTANSPQTVPVRLFMRATTANRAPVGAFDTPVTGATGVQGSIAVTGWALDELIIDRVEIWRDPVAGATDDAPPYTGAGPGNGKIFIANATFIEGARPDIESAFPETPLNYRGGWGYLMLTWGLWHQGNGTFNLYAFAYDRDGASTTLGVKTITVSNATATRPFGSIDVPEYGATHSGSFFNFGWALTPNATPTCTITNGNVFVGIDSGPLVPVDYGDLRTDIAGAFAGFSNGNNAGGHSLINSTTLTNGPHQIGWFVVDNCGRADGVGSRFFNVFNSSLVGTAAVARSFQDRDGGGPGVARPFQGRDGALTEADRPSGEVTIRRNLGNWEPVGATSEGVRVVELKEMERLELRLPDAGSDYVGGQIINGAMRPLPLGSSLDGEAGIFYWQPAAGFLGSFDLEFTPQPSAERDPSAGSGSTRASSRVESLRSSARSSARGGGAPRALIKIVVGPPLRMAIDSPSGGVVTEQPFVVGGWAIDLAAAGGSGIDTVHVWAYPLAGGAPFFLGVAATGGERPDVAAVYGRQFNASAYDLTAVLRPGAYDLVVYVHRTATNRFDGAQVVRVIVP